MEVAGSGSDAFGGEGSDGGGGAIKREQGGGKGMRMRKIIDMQCVRPRRETSCVIDGKAEMRIAEQMKTALHPTLPR